MREMANIRLIRLLSITAVLVGLGARVFAFGEVPPGLNQDEASIGYEAWALLHYGVDRNGFSWPVHLTSWGSGQNALYAYLAIPFVAAFGLSAFTTRLPMLLAGIASVPLVWVCARRSFGEKAAWGAVAAVALSPWHIMLSRWALESNLLPAVFLGGLVCLIVSWDSARGGVWLVCACAMFGACLYAYGTAYLAVPLFVIGALALGVFTGNFSLDRALGGFTVFALISLPIGAYVFINVFKWHTVSVGAITIPRLPVTPRLQTMVTSTPFSTNARDLWHLLVNQSDGLPYNITEPYGILYTNVLFFFALAFAIGAAVLALQRRWPGTRALVACWLIAALPTGFVQEPNINRVNLLLMGLVFAAGVALGVLEKWLRGSLAVAILVLLAWSAAFLPHYFANQRRLLTVEYAEGFLEALQHTQAIVPSSAGHICITGQANMPYIFALFSEHTDPREYLRTVLYVDQTAEMREVAAFGRYTFGLQRCDPLSASAIIARDNERVLGGFEPNASFGLFRVYLRKSD